MHTNFLNSKAAKKHPILYPHPQYDQFTVKTERKEFTAQVKLKVGTAKNAIPTAKCKTEIIDCIHHLIPAQLSPKQKELRSSY